MCLKRQHVVVGIIKGCHMKLVPVSRDYTSQLIAYKRAFHQKGEQMDGSSFLDAYENIDDWFDVLDKLNKGTNLPNGLVPSKTYMALMDTNVLVGLADLRFDIEKNAYLRDISGHVGYSVHPTYRQKGYGQTILSLLKQEAKKYGFQHLIVACDADNIASENIIRANGGVFLNDVIDPRDQMRVKRFVIDLMTTA